MATTSFTEETTLLLEALSQARQSFYDGIGHGLLAPYDHIETRDTVSFNWAPYHAMLREQASHLANDINAFGYHIGQLEAWGDILPKYDIDDQLSLLMEIVDSIATTAVAAPYAIRSRIIFSTSHLSHQANRITRRDWSESKLPTDEGINYKTMLKAGDGWSTFPFLKAALDKLFDSKYISNTGDFRNKYHHRLPPRFQHGQTQTVSRDRDVNGVTSYGFGFVEPLSIAKLGPILRAQHTAALDAFMKYSELAREQLRTIYAA